MTFRRKFLQLPRGNPAFRASFRAGFSAIPCLLVFRAKAVVCKAQKVEFGQAAAAAAVATSLIAGVSGRKLEAIVR